MNEYRLFRYIRKLIISPIYWYRYRMHPYTYINPRISHSLKHIFYLPVYIFIFLIRKYPEPTRTDTDKRFQSDSLVVET